MGRKVNGRGNLGGASSVAEPERSLLTEQNEHAVGLKGTRAEDIPKEKQAEIFV